MRLGVSSCSNCIPERCELLLQESQDVLLNAYDTSIKFCLVPGKERLEVGVVDPGRALDGKAGMNGKLSSMEVETQEPQSVVEPRRGGKRSSIPNRKAALGGRGQSDVP